MNLVRARVEVDSGDVALHLGAHRLDLPLPLPELLDRAGEEVIVGIRPEALDPTRQAPGAGCELVLPVALTEALGSDTLVHLELDALQVVAPDVEIEQAAAGVTLALMRRTGQLTARLPPHVRAVPGERTAVRVDTGRLHFFDPDTELALGR
jgi:multiple sugar transport system ATP-binding protein